MRARPSWQAFGNNTSTVALSTEIQTIVFFSPTSIIQIRGTRLITTETGFHTHVSPPAGVDVVSLSSAWLVVGQRRHLHSSTLTLARPRSPSHEERGSKHNEQGDFEIRPGTSTLKLDSVIPWTSLSL